MEYQRFPSRTQSRNKKNGKSRSKLKSVFDFLMHLKWLPTVLAIVFVVGIFFMLIPQVIDHMSVNKPSSQKIRLETSQQQAASEYTVRGIDVSVHNGKIDWKMVAQQGVHFAYIKATEGTTYIDKSFNRNWKEARLTDMKVGAYHFVSYQTSGKTQAANFIKQVPKAEDALRPMIDIEFEPTTVIPEGDAAHEIIKDIITTIEEHYGVKPILYCNYDSYNRFIRDRYQDYPLWFCDINKPPQIPDGRLWTIWQYSHTGLLEGIESKHTDLNVYKGNSAEFLTEY